MQFAYTPARISSRPRLKRTVDHGVHELRSGPLRVSVEDELERDHRAEAAHVADGREALLPGAHATAHRFAYRLRTLAEALVVDHVEDGERGRLGDRIADERPADGALVRGVEDLRLAEHRREWQPGRDRLRERHHVRLDPVVLDREELAGTREAGLHLVHDQHDPVLVADAAQPLHECLRRRHEPAFAELGLHDDRGDLVGGDVRHEELLELRQRGLGVRAAVVVREGAR